MDTFATQSAAEREKYFREAATRMGLPPQVIEKDFWVCWTLKRLFALKSLEGNLLFKGGTSLSKVYGLIRRFSEDIDLSIHRASLGFEGEDDPANPGLSNKKRAKQSKALSEAARAKIYNEVRLEIDEAIRAVIGSEGWSLALDHSDPDGQSLAFAYPRTNITPDVAAYLKPSVKIEFGARSDHWPAETKSLQPYLAEALPEALGEPETEVKVMAAERTFWEKATILHQMAHLPESRDFPARYSRHYCDLAAMIKAGTGDAAAKDVKLLAAVVAHKKVFYRSAWAKYETAIPGSLRLIPADERIPELSKDLVSMKEMFFEVAPQLEDVIETLQTWQAIFNQSR